MKHYNFTPKIVLFTKYLHCSLSMHKNFASLRSIGPAMHVFFTPPSHLMKRPSSIHFFSTSDSLSLIVNCFPLMHSTCPNHFKTLRRTFLFIFTLKPTLSLTFLQISKNCFFSCLGKLIS